MNHCCAIDKMLLVNQYSTKPDGKIKNITLNTIGTVSYTHLTLPTKRIV